MPTKAITNHYPLRTKEESKQLTTDVLLILELARALIRDESNWCREFTKEKENGDKGYNAQQALYRANELIFKERYGERVDKAAIELVRALQALGLGGWLTDMSDPIDIMNTVVSLHVHRLVIEMFDKAIANIQS